MACHRVVYQTLETFVSPITKQLYNCQCLYTYSTILVSLPTQLPFLVQ